MRATTLCLAAGLVLLTACQDKPEQTTPAATPAVTASTPAANKLPPIAGMGKPGELGSLPLVTPKIVTDTTPVDTQVVDVKLSDHADDKILTGRMTDQFKPDDGVFMSIHTDGTAGKYTLSSKWLTPTGETLTEYSQIIDMAGSANTIFSLSKPDGWAPGQYKVELSINGKPLRTVPFTVR